MSAHADAAAPAALNADEWRSFKLLRKDKVNHNTISMHFGFDDANAVAGLSVASCLVVKAPIGEPQADGSREAVIRPYTPVSSPTTKCAPRRLLCRPCAAASAVTVRDRAAPRNARACRGELELVVKELTCMQGRAGARGQGVPHRCDVQAHG